MKNVYTLALTAVLLQACNMAAKSTVESEDAAAIWIGTEKGAFCVEDFIDELDPTGSAGYKCVENNSTYLAHHSFVCNPTKLSSAVWLEERFKGQDILDKWFGWYQPTSTSTANRAQWSDAQQKGYTGLNLYAIDYPNMDFKICTNRWQ